MKCIYRILTAKILLSLLIMGSSTSYEITGVVINEDEAPVANHNVLLYNDFGEQIASDQTDNDGIFNLTYHVTSAEQGSGLQKPAEFKLGNAYPNPFNPRTTIPFEAPENTNAVISLHNILGQEVMRTSANIGKGQHEIQLNLGGSLAQGQYLLRVRGENFLETTSMTFLSAGVTSGTTGINIKAGGQSISKSVSSMDVARVDKRYRIVIEDTDQYFQKEIEVTANQNHDVGAQRLLFRNEFRKNNWWPLQPVPNGIVKVNQGRTHGRNALTYSLAGLVAKAHKEGKIDELIWIDGGGSTYDKWYDKVVDRTNAEERGTFTIGQLLDRYKDAGIIDGYILYNPEHEFELRAGMDFSYNIAASYAGAENAIIIDESLESDIQGFGFTKILDARDVSRNEYFNELKDRKNRNLIVTMNPSVHNNIDFAIANNAMVTYDADVVTENMMEWVNPVSPVVGWNGVGEDVHTRLASEYGLFNTASDWAHNLILLSAASEEASFQEINTLDPQTIDFDVEGHFHNFIMSDGDNMQWTIGNFVEHNRYWGSSAHGDFPIGFTVPPINLSLMAPDVLDEISITQPEHTTLIEYGPGGYQFPDLFASKRNENQESIQREFARKIGHNLQRTGASVIGFISMDVSSHSAINAYKIYAEEIEGLTGMIAVDFNPYHGGGGEIFWVENSDGIEIPVVTAKYSLWKNLQGFRAGNVQEVANAINSDVDGSQGSMTWTAVHAWSEFENPDNPAEIEAGVKPVQWTINQLNEQINIVSTEELLWRIRMENNPEQTEDIIQNQ